MTVPHQELSEQAKQHPIVQLILSDASRTYIAPFLPKGTDIERVAATVLIAIQNDKTRTLKKCTPQSLVLGVARIQQWGLELGVSAYLLPFKSGDTYEATPVADYKGLAELMIATGAVRYVEARVVYKGDEFRYRMGLDPMLDHVMAPRMDRGPITHGYCVLHLPLGRKAFEVMAVEDVEDIRQKYSKQWKNGPMPAWYVKKTLIRQTSKLLPKNPALSRFFAVLAQDKGEEMGEEIDTTPGVPARVALRELDEDEVLPPGMEEREPGDEEDGNGHIPPF